MIRLARVGARKQPHYRVVVIEKDRARNGRLQPALQPIESRIAMHPAITQGALVEFADRSARLR